MSFWDRKYIHSNEKIHLNQLYLYLFQAMYRYSVSTDHSHQKSFRHLNQIRMKIVDVVITYNPLDISGNIRPCSDSVVSLALLTILVISFTHQHTWRWGINNCHTIRPSTPIPMFHSLHDLHYGSDWNYELIAGAEK